MAFQSSWQWYGVKCLSKIVVEGETEHPTASFCETVYLISAQSYIQACKIAERHAKRQILRYRNIRRQTVCKRFERILDCYCIGKQLESGNILYTCSYEAPTDEKPEAHIRQLTPRI